MRKKRLNGPTRSGRKAWCVCAHCLGRFLCAGIVEYRCSGLVSGQRVNGLGSPCLLGSGSVAFLPLLGRRACSVARVFLGMLGSGLRPSVSPIRKFQFYSDCLVCLALPVRCFGW